MADGDDRLPSVTNPERTELALYKTVIRDLTALQAHVDTEVARQTHAVPAEERTKQAQEKTKQAEEQTKRSGKQAEEKTKRSQELTKRMQSDRIARLGFGGTLAAIAYAGVHDPKWLALSLVAIAGIFGGKEVVEAIKPIIEAIKKKPQ